jgi:hypothetical protein
MSPIQASNLRFKTVFWHVRLGLEGVPIELTYVGITIYIT